MTASFRDQTVVTRRGQHVLIAAPFLDAYRRDAFDDAFDDDRRDEFVDYVAAQAALRDSEDRDACASGPRETSGETERLAGVADELWEGLDLSGPLSLPMEQARRLYELLGVALLAEDGHVTRLIPAARAA